MNSPEHVSTKNRPNRSDYLPTKDGDLGFAIALTMWQDDELDRLSLVEAALEEANQTIATLKQQATLYEDQCGQLEQRIKDMQAAPPESALPIKPWNGGWAIVPTAEAADAFWKYWRENGETHKHGYYESTWGAINRALAAAQPVPPSQEPGVYCFIHGITDAVPNNPTRCAVCNELAQPVPVPPSSDAIAARYIDENPKLGRTERNAIRDFALIAASSSRDPACPYCKQPLSTHLCPNSITAASPPAPVDKDGERYRWLRDQRRWLYNKPPTPGISIRWENYLAGPGDWLDAAIDAAIASSTKREDIPPSDGWIQIEREGFFVKKKRGNEVVWRHEHYWRYGSGDSYDCDWVGDEIRCRACKTIKPVPSAETAGGQS